MLAKIRVFIGELLETVLISLLIIVPVRYFIIQPFFVKGQSMEPNFHDNDYLIVDELSYRLRVPERGEVIVLKSEVLQNQFLIKRIVGLPGETIQIQNGRVMIFNAQDPQGFVLDEPYLAPGEVTDGNEKVSLGPDQYFVMGDNRRFSYDSRRWGTLTRSDIVGRAWIRLWPISSAKIFAAPAYPSPEPIASGT